MSRVAERSGLTEAEYLEIERASETKHEFHRGEMFAMAGAKRAHNLIAGNAVTALNAALRRTRCEVYPAHMRVKSEGTGLYTYPDAVVACGDIRFADARDDTLLNPTVVVEVLSETTESYDRGKKFDHYRAIASLKDYVLVSQDEPLVEHYARQDDGSWRLVVHRAGGRVALTGAECTLAVDELYLKVFDQPAQ
jgi:Uma2 family endonuclease